MRSTSVNSIPWFSWAAEMCTLCMLLRKKFIEGRNKFSKVSLLKKNNQTRSQNTCRIKRKKGTCKNTEPVYSKGSGTSRVLSILLNVSYLWTEQGRKLMNEDFPPHILWKKLNTKLYELVSSYLGATGTKCHVVEHTTNKYKHLMFSMLL